MWGPRMAMTRTIVYLLNQPLDAFNRERFGIQHWLDRGWRVEVWDLTPMVSPATWREFGAPRYPEHVPHTSLWQMARRARTLDRVPYYLDDAGSGRMALAARLLLQHVGARRVTFPTGTIPRATTGPTFGQRMRIALRRGPRATLRWVDDFVSARLERRFCAVRIAIVSGEVSMPATTNTVAVRAHGLDYDRYLAIRDARQSPARPYAVFLDPGYCDHRDFAHLGLTPYATPGRYFPAMVRALHEIGATLKLDVRIACHPRSEMHEGFGDLPVTRGDTAALVRDAACVITHDSTAIQYGILFEKPMIFLTTDEVNGSRAGASIQRFAEACGRRVFNIDHAVAAIEWRAELLVNRQQYAAYRHRYIKLDGSPERPMWEIVIDHLDDVVGDLHPQRRGGRQVGALQARDTARRALP